jgi:polysaccharide pyruvyl transferase WcaK-like protein
VGKTRFDHEITNLRSAPGELSFDARIGERTTGVWMRTDSPVTPNADAALAAAAMPAMRHGGRLGMTDPVSPRMLRGQREFQAIQRAWSLDWPFTEPLREVEVEAPTRGPGPVAPSGRAAAFFSGGIDSWGVVLENPDLTDLIFVRGFDLTHDGPQAVLAEEVEARLREAADGLGLPLHVVTTNLRELSDPELPWDVFFGNGCVAVAQFLAPLFDRVLIAGDSDYAVQVSYGANRLVDQLWSGEGLEIVDAGGRSTRQQRLERLVESPVACRSLRVCWETPDLTYNCGHCRKCMTTLIALEAIGARERVTSFAPGEIDLGVLAGYEIGHLVSLTLWEDLLDAIRANGREDLEAAVAPVIAKGKARLGLPQSFRRRPDTGPEPTAASRSRNLLPAAERPTLFAAPETAAAIAAAESLAFLVGGYDGSGNFGDVLMLDAALELLAPLEPGLLVLPVLERRFAGHHPGIAEQMLHPPRQLVYFDPEGCGEDDLVPIAAGPKLAAAVTYFYGGGYFNGLWGDRKLAMMRAAEAVLAAVQPSAICRVGSGLQVEAAWLANLSSEDAELLRAFELLGTRDPRSGELLAGFGSAFVPESGDDAVAALGRLRPAEPAEGGPLQVSLHYAEHDWVTGEAQPLLDFYAELLTELGQRLGRPVIAQPLVAYLDLRVDERPAAERLGTVLRGRSIEVLKPIVLRPGGLGAAAAQIGKASFTVACSYHVALTSLMMGLPTLAVAHNPFYEQKARGLLDAFGQPDEFAIRPGADPEAYAKLLAATALDPEAGGRLRVQIALDARRMRRLRTVAEADLFTRIAATVTGIDEAAPQWVGADADLDRRVRAAGGRARAAEERAAHNALHAANLEAQMAELTGSTSWRLTAPLRRLVRRMR